MANRDYKVLASDEDVKQVFENTNFGSYTPREIIAETLVKIASGYHSGRTAICCCVELGLLKTDKKGKHSLTRNGGYYLYDIFEHMKENLTLLSKGKYQM